MNRIITILEIWIALMCAANGFSSPKFFPPAAPSTAAGQLIEVAADCCYPCPSPVPPDSRNQAYKSPLASVASQKDNSRSLQERQRGL
jgi:hypothetical protein